MSGANAARTLPPGDRDESPELPIDPVRHDDAPHLTDETDAARIARLTRTFSEAGGLLFEALRLLAEGKHQSFASTLKRAEASTADARALMGVLSRSTTAKR